MKFPLFLLAMLCLFISADAQVQFGAKAVYGTSFTQASTKEFVDVTGRKIYNLSFDSNESRKGIGLSLFAQNELLFLNLDGLYTTTGRNFTLLSASLNRSPLDPGLLFSTAENNVRLVANAGVKLGKLKLGVGPEISLTTSQTEDLSSLENFEKNETNFTTGFNFMAGYIINKHLHLDLRYTYITQDVSDGYTFQGIPLDMRKNAKFLELGLAAYF